MIVVSCPTCQQSMSLPKGAPSGVYECPSCHAQLSISTGTPSSNSSPAKATWESLPPPVRATALATQQGNQVWADASETVKEAEKRRIHEVSRPRPQAPKNYAGAPRQRSKSMNPLVGCFAVVGVVSVIGVVGIAIFFGIAALGGMKSTLRMAGYQTQANGSRRSEKSEGDRNVVAVENRSTKSAFLMVSRDFPPGVQPDVDGYLETLRLNGNVSSSSPTQRAGLNGVRYEFIGRSMTSPTHIGEFYVIGNKAVIVMYMPGNALQQLQGKSSRYTSEKQREIDDPDGFFSSFQSAQN